MVLRNHSQQAYKRFVSGRWVVVPPGATIVMGEGEGEFLLKSEKHIWARADAPQEEPPREDPPQKKPPRKPTKRSPKKVTLAPVKEEQKEGDGE